MAEIWLVALVSVGIVIILYLIFYGIRNIIKIKNQPEWSPIREIFKVEGIEDEDTEKLIISLEEHSRQLSTKALEIAKRNKHRRITSEDIKQAMDEI